MTGGDCLQATVRSYDGSDRSGTLLADDGRQMPFDGAALAAEVRLLRSGQRVQVRLEAGAVAAVCLVFT